MITSITMDALDSTMTSHPEPDTDAAWPVVIAYDDVPAGRRAMHILDTMVDASGERRQLRPLLWRFDILEVTDWRAEATSSTLLANLLIISTSSKGDLPVAVQDWVRSCLTQKQGQPAVVVALLGPADDTDPPDSPRVQFLSNAAAAAGLGFFAPTPPAGRSPRTRASRRGKGLLSQTPTLSSKGGDGEPFASCSGPPSACKGQSEPPLAEAASWGPARPAHQILLVEDDDVVREASAMVLIRAGYQVNAVGGSQAAWEALQSRRYDLLITDNQMPGFSGLELVRKLRSAQSVLPVIMASGGIGTKELNQNQWLRPATVLPKPFTSDALLEMVTATLGHADPASTPSPTPWEPYYHWGINE